MQKNVWIQLRTSSLCKINVWIKTRISGLCKYVSELTLSWNKMRMKLLIAHRNLQICSTLLVQLQVRYFISAYIGASSIRAARDASFWNSFCKSEENFETGCDRKMTTSASFSSMLNFVRFCNLRAEVQRNKVCNPRYDCT